MSSRIHFNTSHKSLVIQCYWMFTVQAYQTSQYVVPHGGSFLGKWRSSFAGNSDGKMNVQSACTQNTRHKPIKSFELPKCR
jgi:hypothetical protein